jgi:ABC-type transport system involved in Fe-S cluster assembly fused permease/ATPase subunit
LIQPDFVSFIALTNRNYPLDQESDKFIQNILRTKFVGTTILTIAHRLETIIDFDQIVVLDAGMVVESGAPAELLQNDGVFSNLVDATGPETSAALRLMAASNAEE